MTDKRYLEIVGWSDHLHPDTTRKNKPPFRWIKLHTENLDVLGDLTLREYGAYVRLLGLAALTNNRIVFKPSVIKRRTGITQKDVEKLKKRGLVAITNQSGKVENIQENQANDSETASDLQADGKQTACPDGIGNDLTRLDLNTSTPCASRTSERESEKPKGKAPGHDERPFADLKEMVLQAIRPLTKLESFDAEDDDWNWNCVCGRLQMSRAQFDACTKQLRQDGQI